MVLVTFLPVSINQLILQKNALSSLAKENTVTSIIILLVSPIRWMHQTTAIPNLRDVNLKDVNLKDVNLKDVNLKDVNLKDVSIWDIILKNIEGKKYIISF